MNDALRIEGGGNNFGIVTEFVLKTHKRGRVYVSTLIFHATTTYVISF